MARAGRPTVEIDLTDQERARLESWTKTADEIHNSIGRYAGAVLQAAGPHQ